MGVMHLGNHATQLLITAVDLLSPDSLPTMTKRHTLTGWHSTIMACSNVCMIAINNAFDRLWRHRFVTYRRHLLYY